MTAAGGESHGHDPVNPLHPPTDPATNSNEPTDSAHLAHALSTEHLAVDATASNALRPRTRDRWAHRRAEPRALAFMWTLYLFVASMLTFAYVGTHGTLSWDVYRPVARLMLVTAAVGIGVLWPMVRLSQLPPQRHVGKSMLADWIVIVLPLAAVILPQAWLAGWPADVVTAVATHLASWALLVAGILMFALGRRTGPMQRSIAMGLCIMLLLAWPIATAVVRSAGGSLPELGDFASPLTMVYQLTADRPYRGHWHTVTAGQWWAILVKCATGLGVCLFGVGCGRGATAGEALD